MGPSRCTVRLRRNKPGNKRLQQDVDESMPELWFTSETVALAVLCLFELVDLLLLLLLLPTGCKPDLSKKQNFS